VGTALIPLDTPKAWMLNDWLVCCIAFNALLFEYVSDEKREQQSPCSCGLSYSVVHSSREFINVPPYDLKKEHQKPLWNEYGALRNKSRLCVLCPKGHIPL
jgi:hypothetical protein